MINILEGIFQGLIQWIYSLLLEIVEYIANGLLDVFSMDLGYFESVIPVTGDILNIIIASGWAFLLGNLIFQTAKSMMSGLGFEAEDPKTLFARTFVFGFFLLASRQICDIGLGISSTLITMLQVPDSVTITVPEETAFTIGASWLLVVIIGFVVMWQIVKLFFEIGERYFLLGFLTMMAPWAFAMGGSKSTADIFKGWVRMFASMCVMMVMNVIFLKMLLSAMGYLPSGIGALPWMILVVAIARVARKIDSIIARIGLNPAITGEGLGRSFPGMLSFMIFKSMASNIGKAAGGAVGSAKTPPHGSPKPSGFSFAGNGGGAGNAATRTGRGSAQNRSNNNSTSQQTVTGAPRSNSPPLTAQPATLGAAGMPQMTANTTPINAPPGAAGTAPILANNSVSNTNTGVAGKQALNAPSGAAGNGQKRAGFSASPATTGIAGTASNSVLNQGSGNQRNVISAGQNSVPSDRKNSNRSSVTSRSSVFQNGAAGTTTPSQSGKNTVHPPIPRSGQLDQTLSPLRGQCPPEQSGKGEKQATRPARYSAVPPVSSVAGAGTVASRANQGDTVVNAQNNTNVKSNQSSSNVSNRGVSAQPKTGTPSGAITAITHASTGAAGMGNRKTSMSTNKPQGTADAATGISNADTRAGREANKSPLTHTTGIGAAGTDTRRSQVSPQSRGVGVAGPVAGAGNVATRAGQETTQPMSMQSTQTISKGSGTARQEGHRTTERVTSIGKSTNHAEQKITQQPARSQGISKANKPVVTTRIGSASKQNDKKSNTRPRHNGGNRP